MPDLSVLINTRDHPAELGLCLAALARQTLARDRWETIVVDDGSRDNATSRLVENFESPVSCNLVRLEPSGRSAARNAGLRAALGERVLFLGDDILAEPDLLEKHLEAAKRFPGTAILGYRFEKSKVPSPVFLEWWDNLRYQDIQDRGNAGFAFFYTCNSSAPREALLQAGGFDERFVSYGWEDLDLGLRLEKRGVRIAYEPEAKASHHHPGVTVGSLCRREYEMAFSACYFFEKWPDEDRVQQIPVWRELKQIGAPGPSWRRSAAQAAVCALETALPVPAFLRPLYRRLVWSCRAQGLRDGREYYQPILETMRAESRT
ncbi:glycosyltransferase [bacterium]|nr:glycosyltransferase [bacterium]